MPLALSKEDALSTTLLDPELADTPEVVLSAPDVMEEIRPAK